MTNPLNRETLKASDLIKILEHSIKQHGDREVYFSDGFFRYGVDCHAECSANYDSPKAMLIKAFSLTTGMNGPNRPIDLDHE